MMRKRKVVILIVGLYTLLGISSVKAQSVWSSPDTYSHTVEIYYLKDDAALRFRASENRMQLDYLSSLIKQNRAKLESKEFSIWVESYVKIADLAPEECRKRARVLSNTLKSYLISSCGVTEKDFTTHNHCGTYDGRQGITIVALGLRYPWDRILPLQMLDLTGISEPVDGQPALIAAPSDRKPPLEQRSLDIESVDTVKILDPHFKVQTWTVTPPTVDNSHAVPNTHNKIPSNGEMKLDSVVVSNFTVRSIKQFSGTSNISTLAAKQQILGLSSNKFSMVMASPKSIAAPPIETPSTSVIASSTTNSTNTSSWEFLKTEQKQPANAAVGGSNATAEAVDSDVVAAKKTTKPTSSASNNRSSFALVPPLVMPSAWGVTSGGDGTTANSVAEVANNNSARTITGINPPALANAGSTNLTHGKSSLEIDTKQFEQRFNTGDVTAVDVDENVKMRKVKTEKAPKARNYKQLSIPTVEIASDGSIKLNAKALEESINKEFYTKQEIQIKEQRVARQKATKTMALRATLERQRVQRESKGRFSLVGLGINALPVLAATPSLQLDFYIHNRFSLSVEGTYSNWNLLDKDMYRTKMWAVSPEFRVWTCKAKQFKGVYVGLYGMMGDYNFRWNSRQGEQASFWSAGLSVGYVLQFGKSNFFMDAGVSGGYVARDVQHYLYHQGDNYLQRESKEYNISPTKVKVTFIYRFFNKRKSE